MQLHRGKTRAIREFDNWAPNYDRSVLNLLLFRPAYKMMLAQVRKRAARSRDTFRVLDIGCGTGTFTAKCLATEFEMEVTGLDMAYNMIYQARHKNFRNGNNSSRAIFAVGDAEHLPFESGHFDMVTCSNSFHHYPDQFRSVCEMRRVIKRGGELLVVDGHRDDPLGYLIFDLAVGAVEKHVRHCSRRQFVKLFKDAGFRKVTQRLRGLLPPIVATLGQA
ncbi:MAG: methyltransferase domain-containing protein [Actinobacteria bacterium]|nr:methyltransferase domain-containing protein [Actinomycetota bacterium]